MLVDLSVDIINILFTFAPQRSITHPMSADVVKFAKVALRLFLPVPHAQTLVYSTLHA